MSRCIKNNDKTSPSRLTERRCAFYFVKIQSAFCLYFQNRLKFLFLHETFHSEKFESVDFKYDNSFSKVHPKIPKSDNFDRKVEFFCFPQILHVDKFEGAGFKYDNSFFKFQSKNTYIRHFWSQI